MVIVLQTKTVCFDGEIRFSRRVNASLNFHGVFFFCFGKGFYVGGLLLDSWGWVGVEDVCHGLHGWMEWFVKLQLCYHFSSLASATLRRVLRD